jgi:hypothetical protein
MVTRRKFNIGSAMALLLPGINDVFSLQGKKKLQTLV